MVKFSDRKMRVLIMVACCLALAMGQEAKRDRQGRLFLVSSSTTTSTLTTSSICYSTTTTGK